LIGDSSCPNATMSSCPCQLYQNCAQCTVFGGADPNSQCGWCAATQECTVAASCTGPIAHDCPCELNKNCDMCRADFHAVVGGQNVECSWCTPPPHQRNLTSTCSARGSCPAGFNHTSCPALCSSITECDRCNFHGCAWCRSKNACADPLTLPSGCGLVAHDCPTPPDECARIGSCDVCRSSRCTWCFDTQRCAARNSTEAATCQNNTYTHCSAACVAQNNCETCQAMTGCSWCKVNDTSTCIDKGFHQCAGTSGVCSAGFATGTLFLGWLVFALILGVFGGAYVVYKRRQGRPVYTSI